MPGSGHFPFAREILKGTESFLNELSLERGNGINRTADTTLELSGTNQKSNKLLQIMACDPTELADRASRRRIDKAHGPEYLCRALNSDSTTQPDSHTPSASMVAIAGFSLSAP
jgi:hypothetical protein